VKRLFPASYSDDHLRIDYKPKTFEVLTRLPGASNMFDVLSRLSWNGGHSIVSAKRNVMADCRAFGLECIPDVSEFIVHIGRTKEEEEKYPRPLKKTDMRFASTFVRFAVAQVLVLRATNSLWRKSLDHSYPLMFEMYGLHVLTMGTPLHAVQYVVRKPLGGARVDVPITAGQREVSWFNEGEEGELTAANDVLYVPPAGYPVIDALMLTAERDLVVFQVTLKKWEHSLDAEKLKKLKKTTRAKRLYFVLLCNAPGDTRLPGDDVRSLRTSRVVVCQAQVDMSLVTDGDDSSVDTPKPTGNLRARTAGNREAKRPRRTGPS
jgi:hypothetical protein